MDVLTLQRLTSNSGGTRGVFIFRGQPLCHSFELPWVGNVRNLSCIPVGSYKTGISVSTKHGNCFRLSNVPDRSDILIHAGNDLDDTKGCILPGLDVNTKGVLNSVQALDRLYLTLPFQFILDVRAL